MAVGGDGTHHEVINGMIDALGVDRLGEIRYALLPVGSGNDWVRTHRIPKRLDHWIERYRRGEDRWQNIGAIDYEDESGRPQRRYFANVAGCCYDAYVVRRSATASIKNRLLYPLLTLWYLKDFSPTPVQLIYEDDEGKSQEVVNPFYTINVGIGRYNGGGMRLVPQADPAGDTFALTYARQLSVFRILLNGLHFYTGRIGTVKEVTTTHARKLRINAPTPGTKVAIEADGEWLGYGPISIELLPAALRFAG